jgi:hypothetical protein
MDPIVYQLHIRAGLASGAERTCGKKQKFKTEADATRASDAHNRWDKRKHDVEPYPCAFCSEWHIGGVMPLEVLTAMATQEYISDSQEGN